jgi:hypothetical protein
MVRTEKKDYNQERLSEQVNSFSVKRKTILENKKLI